MEGKYEFENEWVINKDFVFFVDEIEWWRELRKLELNGYLIKLMMRLVRYLLLLENVLKYIEDGNFDKEDIFKVLILICDFFSRVNVEFGKVENCFNLCRFYENFKFCFNERVDLKFIYEGCEMVYKI